MLSKLEFDTLWYDKRKGGACMKYREVVRIVPGSRMAVLMIHGIVGTPWHFRDLMPLVPEDWSVYNILLDGHGKQVQDFAGTSMAKWKAQVARQVEEILAQHEKLLIVAHSMGTLFSIQAAIRHPDRIPQLFLLGVPFTPHVPPSTAVDAVKIALGLAAPGTTAQAMLDDCGVQLSPYLWKYITWLPRFWELLREIRLTKKLLPQLAVPCRTYQSQKDELVSIRSCKQLEGHPCITNTVLPTSGHFGYSPADLQLLQNAFAQVITQLQ